jgi:hypothetical protein
MTLLTGWNTDSSEDGSRSSGRWLLGGMPNFLPACAVVKAPPSWIINELVESNPIHRRQLYKFFYQRVKNRTISLPVFASAETTESPALQEASTRSAETNKYIAVSIDWFIPHTAAGNILNKFNRVIRMSNLLFLVVVFLWPCPCWQSRTRLSLPSIWNSCPGSRFPAAFKIMIIYKFTHTKTAFSFSLKKYQSIIKDLEAAQTNNIIPGKCLHPKKRFVKYLRMSTENSISLHLIFFMNWNQTNQNQNKPSSKQI